MATSRKLTLINLGDEAEVTRTALQGAVEIGIVVLVGVDDRSVSEDHLEVGDGVASETTGLGVEGVLRKRRICQPRSVTLRRPKGEACWEG